MAALPDIQAQKFTTGANTSGYTLESLKFKVDVYEGANITSRVSIYSEGSDGKPGSGLYSLTGTIDQHRQQDLQGSGKCHAGGEHQLFRLL